MLARAGFAAVTFTYVFHHGPNEQEVALVRGASSYLPSGRQKVTPSPVHPPFGFLCSPTTVFQAIHSLAPLPIQTCRTRAVFHLIGTAYALVAGPLDSDRVKRRPRALIYVHVQAWPRKFLQMSTLKVLVCDLSTDQYHANDIIIVILDQNICILSR